MSSETKNIPPWSSMMRAAQRYEEVPSSEDSPAPYPSRTWPSIPKLILYTLLALLAGAGTATTSILLRAHIRHTSGPELYTCGSSTAEARARGCVMEPMVYGWMPAPCYISDLSAEYTPFEDRAWYTSSRYLDSERIRVADLWDGVHEHIFAPQYHGEHCLFLWRKLALAVQRRLPYLDHKSLDPEHAGHCSRLLMDHGVEQYRLNTTNDVVLGFYRCLKMPWAEN